MVACLNRFHNLSRDRREGRGENQGAVLNGPKLARGVANNDTKEGGAPVEVKLRGAMGGGASVVEEET